MGIELNHLCEKAIIDEHNRELYTYLPEGNGTGKSYALHALTHRLCRMGIPCLYVRDRLPGEDK